MENFWPFFLVISLSTRGLLVIHISCELLLSDNEQRQPTYPPSRFSVQNYKVYIFFLQKTVEKCVKTRE